MLYLGTKRRRLQHPESGNAPLSPHRMRVGTQYPAPPFPPPRSCIESDRRVRGNALSLFWCGKKGRAA